MSPAINHLNIIAVLVFCQLLAEADVQQCRSQYSIFGMMLRGHTFKMLNASISFECNEACNNDFRCHSFHLVIKKNVCELNNRTKEARPDDFISDWQRYYFRRNHGMGEFVQMGVMLTQTLWGEEASWLLRSFPNRAVRVRALAGESARIMFFGKTRYAYFSASLHLGIYNGHQLT